MRAGIRSLPRSLSCSVSEVSDRVFNLCEYVEASSAADLAHEPINNVNVNDLAWRSILGRMSCSRAEGVQKQKRFSLLSRGSSGGSAVCREKKPGAGVELETRGATSKLRHHRAITADAC